MLRAALPTWSLTESGVATQVAPNILSIAHRERLGGGELYAPLSRLDWATLLKRTVAIDLRVCLRCGGRLLVRAVVTEPAVIAPPTLRPPPLARPTGRRLSLAAPPAPRDPSRLRRATPARRHAIATFKPH